MVSNSNDASPQLLSLKKAAARLDVSVPTVRRLASKGVLRAVKIGGQLRIAISDLQAFISAAGYETRAQGREGALPGCPARIER
jgi:excisionase family DNA binding protein